MSSNKSDYLYGHNSKIEQAILNSIDEPIKIDPFTHITANGQTGIWLNKSEEEQFSGPIPISKYPINHDPTPLIIQKKSKPIECKREIAVKYLEPPKISTPGPIIINQMANIIPPTAPPIIIRQPACKPKTPEVVVIRELPPEIPVPPPCKVINLPGQLLPPLPRKVVIERLPEYPDKPANVHVERWLPFKDLKRRVKLMPKPADPPRPKIKNVIINWEKTKCSKINTEIKNLGVEKANPSCYLEKYGRLNLKKKCEMPIIVNEVEKIHQIELAADNKKPYYMELEGDLHALSMIDLDKEGLGEYKSFFQKYKCLNKF
jgi:hypothetical protein